MHGWIYGWIVKDNLNGWMDDWNNHTFKKNFKFHFIFAKQ